MSSYRARKASAGLVSGFLTITACLFFLAAMTIGLGTRDDRLAVMALASGDHR